MSGEGILNQEALLLNNCVLNLPLNSKTSIGKTVTVSGNACLTNAVSSPITSNKTVGYFDGNGDYLSIPYCSDWDLGSADFTIEWWSNLSSYYSTGRNVVSCRTSALHGWVVSAANSANKIGFAGYVGGSWASKIEVLYPSLNVWHHIAITRSGTLWTIWIDGTSAVTATIS